MSQPNTTIILVRHGHVEGIEPARFRGQRELPLTELGRQQAQALSRRIAAQWQPDAIFASPLGRCLNTAAAISNPFQLDPQPRDGLIDIDYGEWQGLTHAEVGKRWPEQWARWKQTPQFVQFPAGESLAELAARTTKALHEILYSHRDGTVVIAAHDSVSRVLLLHALDLPLSRYRAIAQAPCGLNVLTFDGDQFTVNTLNETGYLNAINSASGGMN